MNLIEKLKQKKQILKKNEDKNLDPLHCLSRYLKRIKNENKPTQQTLDFFLAMQKEFPKINTIYIIGASVGHMYDLCKELWKDSDCILFDANTDLEDFYKSLNVKYAIEVLGNEDGKKVDYYYSFDHPNGNSIYKEYSFERFNLKEQRIMKTIDTVVKEKNFPLPELIILDVQGAEWDVMVGGKETFKRSSFLYINIQNIPYNQGAPVAKEIIPELEKIGWTKTVHFNMNHIDVDYYFVRTSEYWENLKKINSQ